MAGKKEKVEPVAETTGLPEATMGSEQETPPETQTQALTPEMEAAIAEAEERGYGRAQEEIDRKETVIKRLQEGRKERRQQPTFQSTDDIRNLEFMIEAEKQRENDTGVPSPLRPQLETEVVRRRQVSVQQKMWNDWQGEIQNQEDALTKKLEDAGVAPESLEAIPIWESFAIAKQSGDFSFANKKADSLIKPKKETKAEKAESEEEKQKRWIEEGKRQALEGGGVLNIPAGGPSGTGAKLTAKQVENMSPDERWERRKEIDEMSLE